MHFILIRFITISAICIFLPNQANADTLTDLRTKLAGLTATSAVTAKATVSRAKIEEGQKGSAASIGVGLSASGSGLQVGLLQADLGRAMKEDAQQDPEAKQPTLDAIRGISMIELNRALNAAPALLDTLRLATLESETASSVNGQAGKLLVLRLQPELSKRDKKYVKKLDATMKLWLDAQGFPTQAEQAVAISGRAMLVVTFESKSEKRDRFRVINDRLVLVDAFNRNTTKGGGEDGGTESQISVQILP